MAADLSGQWLSDDDADTASLLALWVEHERLVCGDLLDEGDLLGEDEVDFAAGVFESEDEPSVEAYYVGEWSAPVVSEADRALVALTEDRWSDQSDPVGPVPVAELLDSLASPPGVQVIDWLTSLGGRVLSAGEALAVAGAWERQSRWLTAQAQGAWLEFMGAAEPPALGPDGPSEAEQRRESSHLLELSLTVDCGVDLVRDKVAQARLLAGTLSATRDRVAAGELSEYRARRIAGELRALDPTLAREIEAKVLGSAPTVRVATLVRRLRRLVLAAQGEAAVTAYQVGALGRRVVVDREAGEVGLLGLHAFLPPELTIAIRELLEVTAAELARADRAARREVKALNRQRAASRARRLAATTADPGAASDVGADASDVGADAAAGPAGADVSDVGADAAAGPAGADVSAATDAAAAPAGADDADADDGPLELPVRRSKDQRMADALAVLLLGGSEADPSRPVRPVVAVQVTVDLATLLHLRDNPGELGGYGPIPAPIARELAGDGAWQLLVYEPVTGYLLNNGDRRYDEGPALTRFRKARDVRDRFPGSTRSAKHADGDHVIAFQEGGGGGETSAVNVASVAKLGHIAKTHNNWQVTGDANGVLTWTSPNGTRYPSAPYDYRPDDDPPPPPLPESLPPLPPPGRQRRPDADDPTNTDSNPSPSPNPTNTDSNPNPNPNHPDDDPPPF